MAPGPQSTIENAFSYLSNLSLPNQHFLHPQACNPAMDLLALLSPGGSGASVKVKGKEKDLGPDTKGWTDTRVSVWRMMSDRVWTVDVKGRPLGLAWSLDGLVLSVILSRPALVDRQLRKAIYVEHLSVHTGELVKAVNLDVEPAEVERFAAMPGWPCVVHWRDSDCQWEAVRPGSSLCILDALESPKPVDPPKPIQLNPFAKPPPPPNPNIPHARLLAFPSLLPSNPPVAPHIFSVQLGQCRRTLLTGSFPVASPYPNSVESRVKEQVLKVAQLSDRLLGLYNTFLRGLDAVEAAWREAAKQNMMWREELEGCASQHGMSRADVHADLFRFLMTGRSNEAVSDWLGAKLTGRTLTKWGETLDNSMSTMRSTIVDSIVPALERALVIYEEIRGWELSPFHSKDLSIDGEEVHKAIALLQGLVKLFHRVRVDVEHEALAAQAWMTWLRYETAKAGASGIDEHPPTATHDLKLTWSFMKNGFVKSALSLYFPDVLPRPPTDELPAKYLELESRPIPHWEKPFGDIVQAVLSRLREAAKSRGPNGVGSTATTPSRKAGATMPSGPSQRNGARRTRHDESTSSMEISVDGTMSTMSASAMDAGESMMDMTMDMTMNMDETMDQSGIVDDCTDDEVMIPLRLNRDGHDGDNDDDNDSTATYGHDKEEEEEAPRFLELEPWVWTNSLLKASEAVIRKAVPLEVQNPSWTEPSGNPAHTQTFRTWRTSSMEFAAQISGDERHIVLAARSVSAKPRRKSVSADRQDDRKEGYGPWTGARVHFEGAEGCRVCAMEFFDDVELALVLQSEEDTRLMTFEYALLSEMPTCSLVTSAQGIAPDAVLNACERSKSAITLPVRRSRLLDIHPSPPDTAELCRIDIALNGRKGRRVGCVMVRGKKGIGIWDMEVDEGDGDDEEGEDGGEVEDGEERME